MVGSCYCLVKETQTTCLFFFLLRGMIKLSKKLKENVKKKYSYSDFRIDKNKFTKSVFFYGKYCLNHNPAVKEEFRPFIVIFSMKLRIAVSSKRVTQLCL